MPFLVVHVYIDIYLALAHSIFSIGLCLSPSVSLPVLLTKELLVSEQSYGRGQDGRAPFSPDGIAPGCISCGTFLEQSSDHFLMLAAEL